VAASFPWYAVLDLLEKCARKSKGEKGKESGFVIEWFSMAQPRSGEFLGE